jgi:sugar phosphate permease
MTTEKKHFTDYKYYPQIVISLCAALLFYKYVLNVSPSIMVHDLMKHFHVNGMQLGSLAATFFYTYTIMQLFAGILLDKFGTRFIAGFSILLSAIGTYLFSIADSLALATVARGMMGCGVAFATVTYFKMSAAWFKPNQLAFVGGLLATAVMMGAVFGQAPLAWLTDHTNWQFVLFFCSILGVVIALLFVLFAYDAPKSPKHSMLQSKHTISKKFSKQEIIKTLKNKQNWLLALYSGLAFAPLSALGGLWGNPFLQEAHHLTRSQAAALSSLLFIGLGIGSPLLGLLSDRLKKRVGVMKLGILLSALSLIALLYTPTPSLLLVGVLLFVFGFATGAFMLGFTVGAQINPLMMAGTAIALINTGDSIFESFTEPLLGKLLDLNWQGEIQNGLRHFTVDAYHIAFIPLLLYFTLAFLVLFFIKEPNKEKITKQ